MHWSIVCIYIAYGKVFVPLSMKSPRLTMDLASSNRSRVIPVAIVSVSSTFASPHKVDPPLGYYCYDGFRWVCHLEKFSTRSWHPSQVLPSVSSIGTLVLTHHLDLMIVAIRSAWVKQRTSNLRSVDWYLRVDIGSMYLQTSARCRG